LLLLQRGFMAIPTQLLRYIHSSTSLTIRSTEKPYSHIHATSPTLFGMLQGAGPYLLAQYRLRSNSNMGSPSCSPPPPLGVLLLPPLLLLLLLLLPRPPLPNMLWVKPVFNAAHFGSYSHKQPCSRLAFKIVPMYFSRALLIPGRTTTCWPVSSYTMLL
jgi:hypothetical protein